MIPSKISTTSKLLAGAAATPETSIQKEESPLFYYFKSFKPHLRSTLPNQRVVVFENYRLKTSDPDIINYLRKDLIPRNFVVEVTKDEFYPASTKKEDKK